MHGDFGYIEEGKLVQILGEQYGIPSDQGGMGRCELNTMDGARDNAESGCCIDG